MLARHLHLHILVAAVALFLFNLETKVTAAVGLPPQPNIVVIMTDDQDDRGSMEVMTKVNQFLKSEGVTFTNSFTDFPLCCPSRATFLTGQYAHNHGVLSNQPGKDGGYGRLHPTAANTLPVWLQQAGYHTSLVGKYLNGYGTDVPQTTVPPGWNKWFGLVDPSTYSYFGYTINEDGSLRTYGNTPADYQTDVLTNKVVEIINAKAESPQPFFIWFTPLAPHAGAVEAGGDSQGLPVPAPRHAGQFNSKPLPNPPSFNEPDFSDKPNFIKNNIPTMSASDVEFVTNSFRKRHESLLAVDEGVERIIGALSSSGKLNNTIIIFTSDNGFFQGEHRKTFGKNLVYEESVRVPLVIRGPRILKNKTRRQLVNNADLTATILDYAQTDPGRILDGRSLKPLLENGSQQEWRSALLIQGLDQNEGNLFGRYKAIRTQRFKYIEHNLSSSVEKELYDLKNDSYELDSINPENNALYASILLDLQIKLSALKNCSGINCWSDTAEPQLQVGDILIRRVGENGGAGSAPAGTKAWVDSFQQNPTNPARFNVLAIGTHNAFATDIAGYTETAGTCVTDSTNQAGCVVDNFDIVPNCDGESCGVAVTVSQDKLTKIAFKYTETGINDTDSDGLLDSWEISFFLNLNQSGSGDGDNDGLSNIDEFNNGTDPTLEDTDGDGYNDKDEIDNGSDPWDPADIPSTTGGGSNGGGGNNGGGGSGGGGGGDGSGNGGGNDGSTNSSIFPGLVPCGFGGTPCTICHFWVLADRIIDFLTKWMALPILTVAILIGGLFILFAAGDSGKITQGKKIITSAVIGIFIAFGGWLIVNTVINTLGQGELTWSWNTISSCPAPLGGDGGGGGGGNQTDKFSCNNQGQCVSASNGQYQTSNCDNQCQQALRCSASQVSPLVNAIISCVTTAAAQAGVDVRTPTANQISQGQHTCNLNSNPPRISCHYGGRLCNGTGHAVDFSLATTRNATNWSRLLTIVQNCGTRGARCEMGQAPYVVGCNDPRVNHIHANTTQNCGCN